MISLTGRNAVPPRTVHFREPLEIRLVKHEPALHTGLVKLEMRIMKRLCKPCSVCGGAVMPECLPAHCKEKGDLAHLALEVMES